MRGRESVSFSLLFYLSFRLLNKVEDLERLMNDEVTDINEILNVIDTIQVHSGSKWEI